MRFWRSSKTCSPPRNSAQDKLDLAKTELSSGISRRNDEPHGIVEREFEEIIYGRDNPYGWREEYDDVNRIQRADLIAFYKRYFFPANIMLAIHGDFSTPRDESQARNAVRRLDLSAAACARPSRR